MTTSDNDLGKLLYVAPAAKDSNGKSGGCYTLYEGNEVPQKQYSTVNTFLRHLIEEQTNKTKQDVRDDCLYRNKVSRGKTFFLPNGQIFVQVSILSGRNGYGYISLLDTNSMYTDNDGNGVLVFGENEATLKVNEKDKYLHDRVVKAKQRFCEGFTPADFLWEFKSEREKLQNQLVQPGTDVVDVLQMDHCLAFKLAEFLKRLPPEEQQRAIQDFYRKFGRFDSWKQGYNVDLVKLSRSVVYVLFREYVTKEDKSKIIYVAKNQELVATKPIVEASESPVVTETPKKYWSAASSIVQEETEEVEEDVMERDVITNQPLGVTADEISQQVKRIWTDSERNRLAQIVKAMAEPYEQWQKMQKEQQKAWEALTSQLPSKIDWKTICNPYSQSFEIDKRFRQSFERERKALQEQSLLAAISGMVVDDPVMRYSKQMIQQQKNLIKQLTMIHFPK